MPDELPPLTCTGRAGGLRLHRAERALVCPAGHSYDLARRGYVNLLQPQDRRSRDAGDRVEATRARARLLDAGIGRAVLDAVSAHVLRGVATVSGRRPVVADLGCGSGHLLGGLIERAPLDAVGFDLSTAAIQDAAHRWPQVTWAVANVDRRVTLVDGSADVIASVNARRNPSETARALGTGGTLLVGVPAADDLMELRAAIGGTPEPRHRHERLLREHAPWFDLLERYDVRERHALEREPLLDLLRATYRGERHSAAERVNALARLEVTLAADLFAFRVRG